jgi:hypothetical protein
MTDFVPGDFITEHFGPASKTGLVQGDFAVTIMKNGSIVDVFVEILEVGNSFYYMQFQSDNDDNAVWSVDILETPNKSRFQQTFVLKSAETADVIQQNGTENTVPNTINYVRVLTDQIDQRQTVIQGDLRAVRGKAN